MLESIISSKTRLNLLVKFFISELNQGHLRGLSDEFSESTNAIRKELNQLAAAGFLIKEKQQNRIVYKANVEHPLFDSLRSLVRNYLNIDQLLEQILAHSGKIERIMLVSGSIVGDCLEIVIKGNDIDKEYLNNIVEKAKMLLNREIALIYDNAYNETKGILLY